MRTTPNRSAAPPPVRAERSRITAPAHTLRLRSGRTDKRRRFRPFVAVRPGAGRSRLQTLGNDGTHVDEESGKGSALELGDNETGLLEDCHEDWRALWEIPSGPRTRSIDESIGFLVPLIEGGYLTTLEVTAWEQARAAAPMNRDVALTVVRRSENYTPPAKEGETFYLLSITPEGEAAIPPGAFPND